MSSTINLDPALQWAKEKYLAKDIFCNSRTFAMNEIRRALLSIADSLVRRAKQEIPFQPDAIAPFRRVKEIVETELSIDAMLIPEIGGFVIKIKRSLHPFKKRFACAHELGHTFFFNIDVDPPQREFQYQKSSYWVQEDSACAIAREILVPLFSVRPIIEKEEISPSISALRYLSALYQVSFDVLRYKLVNDAALWDCIILTSTLSEGKIVTKGRDISKGASYRDFVMPKVVQWNGKLPNMFYVLSSALSDRIVKDEVKIGGKKYAIESILLDETRRTVLSLLRGSSGRHTA
jgi:Zn-dependent peptidase ImmA (M78 family)